MVDARFAKPLDADMILNLARNHEALITVEEGAIGRFGSHVAQLLADQGLFDRGLRYRSMVLRTRSSTMPRRGDVSRGGHGCAADRGERSLPPWASRPCQSGPEQGQKSRSA